MQGMIISIGGTTEPIIKSIIEHKAEYVVFFASQQSVDKIYEVKKAVSEQGHSIKDYKILCDDVNDIIHCYTKALECTKHLSKLKDINDVVVDYTGGTKNMTAALALATIGHGYNFSYIGGSERTKDGLGIVVTGTEIVKKGISPWQIFAIEEKKRISLFVNSFQYEAAITTIRETMNNLSEFDKQVWSALADTLEGYFLWDNFKHKDALQSMSKGLKVLRVIDKNKDESLNEYIKKTDKNFDVLSDLSKKTSGFNKLHQDLVKDLISNANRRYLQNKYDDAVARLYRSIEMVGQIFFEELTKCKTGDVKAEKLPENLREEYLQKYFDGETIKLPLYATFRVLKEMNHEAGINFFNNEDEINKILSARNNSILAHGLTPVKKGTYETFFEIIKNLITKDELIEFPKLEW
ncbi:MAG: TIGR02710 family CRISPR-associated protein [Desulfobacterales bacterium]|nr:TIGR02710 family CRISPR-associated protein [Desulfobacterales bacterium]